MSDEFDMNAEMNEAIRAKAGFGPREPEPVVSQPTTTRVAGSFDGGARLNRSPERDPSELMNERLRSRPLRDPYGHVVGTYNVAKASRHTTTDKEGDTIPKSEAEPEDMNARLRAAAGRAPAEGAENTRDPRDVAERFADFEARLAKLEEDRA